MTPQELKNSILQLAIQGKLVQQRPEDGTAKELYREIQAEKKRLIKAGKIKKEKPLPEIVEEEKPFEIPENWMWVRLGRICQLLDGEKRKGEDFPYLEARFLRDLAPAHMTEEGRYVAKGTHIILVDGENSGEVFLTPADGYMGSTFRVLFIPKAMCTEYVLYFLQYYRKRLRDNKIGAAIPHLNKRIFFNLLLPLPPLAEQRRMVARIEEFLPYIDRYEQAWSCLESFNRQFPDDMKKSILQLAIQGDLVEQRPEEGTAEALYRKIQAEKQQLVKDRKIKKEKPLPEIKEVEKPFEIPESWKWVRLGSLLRKLVDGTHRTPKYTSAGVPFVSVRNISGGKLDLSDTKYISPEEHRELWKRCDPERNDILLSKIGTTGVPAVVDTDVEFSLFVSVALLKFNTELLDIDFLVYAILTPDFQRQCREHTRGVGNKNWVIVDIANTVFPLPPLAEQKRIVAKLKQLLPLCEKLK